ncbi:MAG TPA: transposase, partial [Gemmatimonadales bacterium]
RTPCPWVTPSGRPRQGWRRWRRKYGGLQVNEARRLKALDEENRQLKRLVADQALNLQVVKDLLGKKWWPFGRGGRWSPGS